MHFWPYFAIFIKVTAFLDSQIRHQGRLDIVSYIIALAIVILAVFHFLEKVPIFVLLRTEYHTFSAISLEFLPTPKLASLKSLTISGLFLRH